jgi:hypothetical protein
MTDFNTKNPFKVPENYFINLNENILNNSEVLLKNSGFKVPKNYFDLVQEKIILEVSSNAAKRVLKRIIISFSGIAASLFVFFSISYTPNTQPVTENQSLNNYLEEYYIENLDSYEMISMLEDVEIDKILKLKDKP